MNNKVIILLQYFLILFILCSCNNKKQKIYVEKCEKIEIAKPSNEYYEATKKDKKELNYIDSNINKLIFDEGLLSEKDIIYMMCFEKKNSSLSKDSIIKIYLDIAPYLKDSISYYYDHCE